MRWLFADERLRASRSIGRFADLQVRIGDYAIYRLSPPRAF